MKLCPTCKNKYPDDANFCPREECADAQGPQRLTAVADEPAARFVPLSRLGGGPSGEVWQASDAQSGGAVAYKLVAPEVLPNLTALERAQRELRQLQRASNPRIVKIIDFGKTPEGRLYVASELASGEPLDQVLAQSGPFSLDRAKRIAAQIGEALLEAQKVGVVHRDLAAKNVLVSADDEVKIINFAVPRPLRDNIFGVPEYMSPEQSEGKLIDQRSNTYSLGALFYLMLTGSPPHGGATPEATIESIQKGEITPPGIKRGGGLTPEVDRIVMKALERNSSRRPLTMRQFLTDVSGLVVKEPSASAASAGEAAREGGFARTMMFAGGASEVQKLVAQAVAARQAAGNGASEAPGAMRAVPPKAATPPPASAPVMSAPPSGTPPPTPRQPVATGELRGAGGTPSPAERAAHGAAIAATMIAPPASNPSIPGSSAGVTSEGQPTSTPPSSPSRNLASAKTPMLSATAAPTTEAGNFRETLWFKKGDVDQMVAEARAKMSAIAGASPEAETSGDPSPKGATAAGGAEPDLPVEDVKPLEDRYVDDGTVTVEDRQKFSLGSGSNSTKTGARTRTGAVPGERMSENEMLDEIGGGKRLLIVGIVAAVVVTLVAVVAVSMKGKTKDNATVDTQRGATGAPAPEKVASPPVPAAPAQPPVPTPAPPAEKAAAASAQEEKAEQVTHSNPSKKKAGAKKKPAVAKPAASKKHR